MSSPPEARWILREPDNKLLAALGNDPAHKLLPPLVLRLLAQRGFPDADTCAEFLHPRLASLHDPFALPGMKQAVERILQAVDKKESVILYGDYDVDGVTSLTLMTHTLRAYGLQPRSFLPLRMEEGYGLSLDGLSRCFEEHGKPALLIALDCGTGSVTEAAWLAEQGVDCVIVDHHEPNADRPKCAALLNPKLGVEQHYFCTVGLVFKLAHALLKMRRVDSFDLREHLDLVALGTVADLVPLHDENRILVQRGLEKLGRTKRPGLRALKQIVGLDGEIQTHHIGYRLGPRLNAAGRLDTAQTALDLLLCEDANDARDCAELLDAHNRERQSVEEHSLKDALSMIEADPALTQRACIVLGSRAWHPGVVGIVASRIMRDYHRPALIIAFGEGGIGKGSGRSVSGISLLDALDTCRHLIMRGGGHAMAAGVTLEEKNLVDFREAMCAAVESQAEGDELTARHEVDAELNLKELTDSFFDSYSLLEPFGMGNHEPVFLCRGVEPVLPGQILREKHWKLHLRQGRETRAAIWFNAPVNEPPAAPWDVTLRLQRQVYRGRESWQIMVSHVRSAE